MNLQKLLALATANLPSQLALEKIASMAQWLCGYGAGHVLTTSGELKTLDTIEADFSHAKKVVVIDGGANVGDFSDHILNRYPHPGLELHLFEPLPKLAAMLRTKYSGLKNVFVNDSALSESSGTAFIYTTDGTASVSSMSSPAHGRFGVDLSEKIEIITTTLDEYCLKKAIEEVNFLKLDIEGYEYPALKGASRLMSQGALRRILFEFGDACLDSRYFLRDIYDLLIEKNFNIGRITPGGFVRILGTYSEKQENFRVTNYFAQVKSLHSQH